MHTYSMNYYEAYIFVKDRRYSINPNRGFKRQLCEWDQKRKVERSLFRFIFFFIFWGDLFPSRLYPAQDLYSLPSASSPSVPSGS